MRTRAFIMAAAAALVIFPATGFSQTFEIGPGGVRIGEGRGRGGGGADCQELRAACQNKDRLGEGDGIAVVIARPAGVEAA